MNVPPVDPERAGKVLAPWPVKLKVIAAAAAVLVLGRWLAPAPRDTVVPVLQERPNPLIAEQVAPPPGAAPFDGVHDLASRVAGHAVAILPAAGAGAIDEWAGAAGAGGLAAIVRDGYLITYEPVIDGRDVVRVRTGTGAEHDARVRASDPQTGLVLLTTEVAVGPPALLASDAPAAGRLLVAAAPLQPRPAAWPMFAVSAGERHLTATPSGAVGGAPVFAPDGSLVGVTAGLEGGTRVLRVTDGLVAALVAQAIGARAAHLFGVTLQAIDGPLSAAFDGARVVVSDLVPGGPADQAGLRIGDAIVGVATSPGPGLDQLPAWMAEAPGAREIALQVRRRGQTSEVSLVATPAHRVAALVRRAPSTSGPRADDLLPEAVRRAAGLAASAEVLGVRVEAQPATAVLVERALRAGGPVVLRVRRGGAIQFVVVEVPR